MSDLFDAYHKWLGIAPAEQPPNLYRLLGLRNFESNRVVIRNAADRQMIHLRSYQLTEHASLSEQLLNEVSNARLILLDDKRKAEYDSQLANEPKPEPVIRLEPAPPLVDPCLRDMPPPSRTVRLRPMRRRRIRPPAFTFHLIALILFGVLGYTVVSLFLTLQQSASPVVEPSVLAGGATPAVASASASRDEDATAARIAAPPDTANSTDESTRGTAMPRREIDEPNEPDDLWSEDPFAEREPPLGEPAADRRPPLRVSRDPFADNTGRDWSDRMRVVVSTFELPSGKKVCDNLLVDDTKPVVGEFGRLTQSGDPSIVGFLRPNGQPLALVQCEDGVLHGPALLLHSDGQVKMAVRFERGTRDGPLKTWDEEHGRKLWCEHRNGKPDGLTYWFENDALRMIIEYRKNRPVGYHVVDDGELIVSYAHHSEVAEDAEAARLLAGLLQYEDEIAAAQRKLKALVREDHRQWQRLQAAHPRTPPQDLNAWLAKRRDEQLKILQVLQNVP